MTGQLITSFLQGKVNPTMTSTISNHSVDPVMVESKTGYYSGSHGETPGINKPQSKTVGGRVGRALNDLLPYAIRPIKSKRRRLRGGYGIRHELFTFRMVWRSHYKRALINSMNKLKFWERVSK
jgi:rRNA maturation protein Rpf1